MGNNHISGGIFTKKPPQKTGNVSEESNDVLKKVINHFKKEWLSERNIGWHSGLVPGSVTSNNGLEVTNRIFKANLKGMQLDIFLDCVHVKSYVSHITMTSIIYIAGELVSATQCLDYISSYICTESILRTPGDVNYKAFSSLPKKDSGLLKASKDLLQSQSGNFLQIKLPSRVTDLSSINCAKVLLLIK